MYVCMYVQTNVGLSVLQSTTEKKTTHCRKVRDGNKILWDRESEVMSNLAKGRQIFEDQWLLYVPPV